jgi:hypothetical protein
MWYNLFCWWTDRHKTVNIPWFEAVPSGRGCFVMRGKMKTLEERFWKYVDKKGDNDCWVWKGYRQIYGYGQIFINKKSCGTHRVMWELVNGPIPEGLFVCHHCDNPPCCNLSHLFLGTSQDNVNDMMQKGRFVRYSGSRNGKDNGKGRGKGGKKLTMIEATEIRELRKTGLTFLEIGNKYRVSAVMIYYIVSGKFWKQSSSPVL